MSSTHPQMTPPGGDSDMLVDEDDFFETAARGELPEARPGSAAPQDHSGLGAASLPRPPASAAAPARRRSKPSRTRSRPRQTVGPNPPEPIPAPRPAAGDRIGRRLSVTVSRPLLLGVAGGGCVVLLVVLALASRAPRVSPRPPVAGAAVALTPVILAEGRVPNSRLDVLSPRLAELTGARPGAASSAPSPTGLSATVADGASGIKDVRLLANGRPLAAARPPCRRGCPSAARFRFALPQRRSGRPLALALAARDADGNATLLWQQLLTPATRRGRARLSASFAGQATNLTVASGAAHTVSGRLTTPAGAALAHRRVQLLALSRSATARPRPLGSATTDAAGDWNSGTLRARRGELLIARHPRASSHPLTLAVRSPLSARRHGRHVVGRLAPGARGVTVVLARRTGRRWRALARTLAGRDGRYRLELPTHRRRGRLAVFAGESANWPYQPASRLLPR